ncbi:MAG: YraN family protein [Chloroflexi bacterium]|nr:MAG: YraN family protein [Chloroflexota bacterium]
MPHPRQTLGQRGESFVVYRLQQAGHTILERNWRLGALGEIDIAARDSSGEIMFVEVRTRRGPAEHVIDEALASIRAGKQAKLIRLAQAFLDQHDLVDVPWRIDVAAVGYEEGVFTLEMVHDAVEW